MDASRKHDIKEIESGLKDPDPNIRRQAKNAGDKIKRQLYDGWLKGAREKLVHESSKGRNNNANDIRDNIVRHEKLGIGRTSFGFSLPDWYFQK